MQGTRDSIARTDDLIKKKEFYSLTILALCFSSFARARDTASEGNI